MEKRERDLRPSVATGTGQAQAAQKSNAQRLCLCFSSLLYSRQEPMQDAPPSEACSHYMTLEASVGFAGEGLRSTCWDS